MTIIGVDHDNSIRKTKGNKGFWVFQEMGYNENSDSMTEPEFQNYPKSSQKPQTRNAQ